MILNLFFLWDRESTWKFLIYTVLLFFKCLHFTYKKKKKRISPFPLGENVWVESLQPSLPCTKQMPAKRQHPCPSPLGVQQLQRLGGGPSLPWTRQMTIESAPLILLTREWKEITKMRKVKRWKRGFFKYVYEVLGMPSGAICETDQNQHSRNF